jgi:hypothetical protein
MPRHRCSNAVVGGTLIAAAAILLPAILYAQEGGSEVGPPPPGVSWGSPPAEFEPAHQGTAAQGTAQDQPSVGTQNAEAAQDQVLMAQQVMAEQARRIAELMFWQIVLGVALLIGLCVTIYYARQLAHAAVNATPKAHLGPADGVPTQHAQGAHINPPRKVKP